MELKNKVESLLKLDSKRAMLIAALMLVSMMLFIPAGCGSITADQQLEDGQGAYGEDDNQMGTLDSGNEDDGEFEAAGGEFGDETDEYGNETGEYGDETDDEFVVSQEQPQTTPDSDETDTVIVDSEEPQTDPAQDTETGTESTVDSTDSDDSSEVTVDPDEPESTPGTSGTVLPIISLGALLLSGGVLLRKYKEQ